MERASEGNFAYISWKTYQQDIIARNFVDSDGSARVYQVRLLIDHLAPDFTGPSEG